MRLKQGNYLLIFPEGSRQAPDEFGQFQRGAFHLATNYQVPIIPIAHNAGSCWSPFRWIIKPGLIEVKIGQPIQPADKSMAELIKEAQSWMQA